MPDVLVGSSGRSRSPGTALRWTGPRWLVSVLAVVVAFRTRQAHLFDHLAGVLLGQWTYRLDPIGLEPVTSRTGHWYLGADDNFAASGGRTWRGLWDFGPVSVDRSRSTLLLAHPRNAGRLPGLARQVGVARLDRGQALKPAMRGVPSMSHRQFTQRWRVNVITELS